MKYEIKSRPDGLDIQVSEVSGKEAPLLAAFQACQGGHCSCPTTEYTKLEDLQVAAGADGITLQLKARAGEQFDAEEIARCLDYTREQVEKPSEG